MFDLKKKKKQCSFSTPFFSTFNFCYENKTKKKKKKIFSKEKKLSNFLFDLYCRFSVNKVFIGSLIWMSIVYGVVLLIDIH